MKKKFVQKNLGQKNRRIQKMTIFLTQIFLYVRNNVVFGLRIQRSLGLTPGSFSILILLLAVILTSSGIRSNARQASKEITHDNTRLIAQRKAIEARIRGCDFALM